MLKPSARSTHLLIEKISGRVAYAVAARLAGERGAEPTPPDDAGLTESDHGDECDEAAPGDEVVAASPAETIVCTVGKSAGSSRARLDGGSVATVTR